mmetsp:Transcript_42905/g.89619  ORF Transcript_42905/g.89619 Transcript_42905/m.89619 type:complete len:208 (-) Transcript_42905:733-1356(-)
MPREPHRAPAANPQPLRHPPLLLRPSVCLCDDALPLRLLRNESQAFLQLPLALAPLILGVDGALHALDHAVHLRPKHAGGRCPRQLRLLDDKRHHILGKGRPRLNGRKHCHGLNPPLVARVVANVLARLQQCCIHTIIRFTEIINSSLCINNLFAPLRLDVFLQLHSFQRHLLNLLFHLLNLLFHRYLLNSLRGWHRPQRNVCLIIK